MNLKFCLILLKTKCKSTGSLMSIPFKTPVFLFPTLFFFCILIFFVTKIVFLRNRLMILFINWYKTSSSLEKSEPHRFSLKKCEFIHMLNSLSYSWLIHVECSSIIHEEKKNWGKVIQVHLIQKLAASSAQFTSPWVQKCFLSHIYDWIQHNKLISKRYIWDTWKK